MDVEVYAYRLGQSDVRALLAGLKTSAKKIQLKLRTEKKRFQYITINEN